MTKILGPDEIVPERDLVGHMVTNHFGVQEIALMRQEWWDFYKWLQENVSDTQCLVRHCYNRRPQLPLGEALTWLLWHIAWHRYEYNLENPEWLKVAPPPPGYDVF